MPTISGAGYAVTMLNKILAVTGALLVATGVLLGFRSVSAANIDCGSAFQPAAGITPMACDNALDSSSTLVTIFIGVGVLCLLAALAVKLVHAKVVRDKVNA